MAVTKTQRVHNYSYSRIGILDVLLDNSYPTGGYSIVAADFGLNDIIVVIPQGAGGLLYEFDYANKKLLAKYPTGGGTSPAALAAPTTAAGGVAVTSSAATAPLVPGIGKEVANATDLSSITVRLVALGS